MAEITLVLASVMLVLEGAVYLGVGQRILRTAPTATVHHARFYFSAWWHFIGANKLIYGTAHLLALGGAMPFPLFLTILHLNFVILGLSLLCLLYYFLFLLTGKRGWIVAVSVFYVFFTALLNYNVLVQQPVAYALGEWRINLVNAAPPSPLLGLAVVALMVLPPILGALAYLALLARVKDRALRFRILLVSTSIIAWTAGLLLTSAPQLASLAAAQVASRLVGVVAALACVLAYSPPAWVRTRLRLPQTPIGDL